MKTVGIVILNYHGDRDTEECLDSLLEAKSKYSIRIYVVDVQNPDKKWQVANNVKIIPLSENLGFSGANNVGIRAALKDKVDFVVLLNNDTIVSPGFIDPLIETLKDETVAMASPLIYFYPGNEFHKDAYSPEERGKVVWYAGGVLDWNNMYGYHWGVDEVDHGHFKEAETDFATGCCVALRKNTLKKIGMLDDRFFLYWEDVEWSVRAKQKGFSIRFEPNSVIWHKNAGSTGGSGSKIHQYYQTRNRIIFAATFASLRTRFALLRESARNYFTASSYTQRGIRDGWMNKTGKVDL